MKLSIGDFERARKFVEVQARPVDRALFAHFFTGGPAEDVLAALAAYQNGDGGFGHGLEPDFRAPGSSPMATSVALQYAQHVRAPEDHPLIRRAIAYLEATYEMEGDFWPATNMDVNDYPHAPWWGMDEPGAPATENWANPSAELAGYLHQYAGLVSDWLRGRTARKMEQVLAAGVHNNAFPFYNHMCWERALPHMPAPLMAIIEAHLRDAYQEVQPLDQEKLGEIRIFMLVDRPDAVLARLFPDTVADLLEAEIGKQAADGAWWPGWEWGMYPEVWPVAKQEWAGKLTVECLLALRNFGKLALS